MLATNVDPTEFVAALKVRAAEIFALAVRVGSDPGQPEREWCDPAEWYVAHGFLQAVIHAIESAECDHQLQLIEAYLAGEICERARLRLQTSPTLDVGDRTKRGGIKGAETLHGTMPVREARRAEYQAAYVRYCGQFPEAGRMQLLSMVARDFGVEPSTIGEWVPNPNPSRRGRPRGKK